MTATANPPVATPAVPAAVPAPTPRAARLARITPATVVVQVVVAALIASLAASRAEGGALSPLGLAAIAIGTAMATALIAWPAGLYAGALEVLDGGPVPDCDDRCPSAVATDPFTGPALGRRAGFLALVVGAWALGSAGLVAAVLDNRPARTAVIVVALVGIGASAGVIVDAAARHRGAHAAVRLVAHPPAPVALRRRAWREVALPLAAAQVVVNGGMAWVLFHDAAVDDPRAAGALTSASAFADVPIVVTILAVTFAVVLAGAWGGVDARLGRVELDDDAQRVKPSEPIGPQAVVYVALGGFLLADAIGFVLPSNPSLVQVVVARGLFAGTLIAVFAAFGYVRGAVNGMARR